MMRNLILLADEKIRAEMGEYYIVPKNRLENLLLCFEKGAKRITELTEIVKNLEDEVVRISKELIVFENSTI
jgi:hypothetical protein